MALVAYLSASLLLAANLSAQSVLAADAEKGRLISQSRCAPCHIVVPMQRQEWANSPPFDQIARRNDLNPEMVAAADRGAGPRSMLQAELARN
jgi:cytochrome c2